MKSLEKAEKSVKFGLIFKSTALNVLYIIIIFLISSAFSGVAYIAILYTMLAYTLGLAASAVFWINWTFNNIKAKNNTKIAIVTLLIISTISGIVFLGGMVSFFWSIILSV